MVRWTIGCALLLAACGTEEVDGGATTTRDALVDPWHARETAPDEFTVRFETTKGHFVVEVHRDWAPEGADRFYNLVRIGFFEDIAFFRVVKGFVVQFGIHGDPAVSAAWRQARIADDPRGRSNVRGTLTFATGGPDTRTTQLFINLGDNTNLDRMGFTPIGKVIVGMDVVASLYGGYAETPSNAQPAIERYGNEFLRQRYPKLDYIERATIVE